MLANTNNMSHLVYRKINFHNVYIISGLSLSSVVSGNNKSWWTFHTKQADDKFKDLCVVFDLRCQSVQAVTEFFTVWMAQWLSHWFREREREMFYLTTHSTHFIYGYMASDIRLRTILIVKKETRCRQIGYSYRLTARVLLYAPSHRQDNTYHCLCFASRGALAGTRNSSMGPPHEGSIQRPIVPWANVLPLSYISLRHWFLGW